MSLTELDRAALAASLDPGRERVEVPAGALTRLLDAERALRAELESLRERNTRLGPLRAEAVATDYDPREWGF